MADVKVNTQQSSDQSSRSQQQGREGGRGLQRRRDLSAFSLMPSEFFSADPFSLMRRMHDEMDRSFGRLFGGQSSAAPTVWNPAIEVTERGGQLHVSAELPGLKPEDVKVEVTDDALVIQGERKEESENKEGGIYRSERRYGQFYREIPLPEGVKGDQAKAQFHDGILDISLPMPEQKSSRRSIPIEGSSSGGGSSNK